ncbi:MAG: aquaporin family protein [Pseudomonadota bacterium]|nr:aquaporin family protein [Pseudomonadota bacterium]
MRRRTPAPALARRLAAEALGSFFLFATVVGSGIMGQALGGGNDGIALLGNSIATGAMLYVLIVKLGPVSGAHFNAAVTLAFALRREISAGDAACYLVVQLAAGLLGVIAAHAMFDLPLIQQSLRLRDGPGQWLSEAIAAFGLLITILGTIRHRAASVPASVALYIAAAYWFTSSTSFANPTITIARSLTDSFAGIAPSNVTAFVLMQLLGAGLAVLVAHWLFAPEPQ